MGLATKVAVMSEQLREGARVTLISLLTWSLKIISALVIGLTFALIGQQAFEYGNLAFLTVLIVAMGLVVRWIGKWNLVNVIVFDLIIVLVGLALKMYIMLAP